MLFGHQRVKDFLKDVVNNPVIGSLLIFRNAEHTTKSSSLVNAEPLLATFFFFAALCDFNNGES